MTSYNQPATITRGRDPWRRVVLFARFTLHFIEGGFAKSLGVLIPSLAFQLNTTYTTVGLITSLGWSISYMACPVISLLAKRIHPRIIAITGGLISGICVSSTAFVNSATMMGFFLSTAGFGTGMVTVPAVLFLHEHWEEDFAFASIISLTGSLVGTLVLPVVTELLLEAYGLKGALLLLGGIYLHMFIVAALLRPPRVATKSKTQIKHVFSDVTTTNENEGVSGNAEHPCANEIHAIQNGRTIIINNEDNGVNEPPTRLTRLTKCLHLKMFVEEPQFTLLTLPSQFLLYFAFMSWLLFVVPYAVTVGIPESRAVFLSTVGSFGGILSRLSLSWALRKQPTMTLHFSIFGLTVTAIAFILQTLNSSYEYLLACSFFIGAGVYGIGGLIDSMTSLTVSTKHFPTAIATTYFFVGSSGVITGSVTGLIYDVTGSFRLMYYILAGLMCMASVLLMSLIIVMKRTPRYYRSTTAEDASTSI